MTSRIGFNIFLQTQLLTKVHVCTRKIISSGGMQEMNGRKRLKKLKSKILSKKSHLFLELIGTSEEHEAWELKCR